MKNAEENPETSVRLSRLPAADEGTVLPLFIKKYQKGHFTSAFLSRKKEKPVEISHPRGRGLSLHDMPPGRIIILAGGTGFHPFCDLIDLLYKSYLVEGRHPKSSHIENMDPIVKNNPFNRHKFSVYVSMDHSYQIHPVTIFQLSELSKANRI